MRLSPWLAAGLLLLTTSLILPTGMRPVPRPGPPGKATAVPAAVADAANTAIDLALPTVVARRPLLVLPVAFPGSPDRLDLARVARLYFGSADSVAAYFRDNSYGVFDLTGRVVGHGGRPLLMPHPASYYAALGAERGTVRLVADAARLLGPGFDWSAYAVGRTVPYLALVLALPEANDPNSPFYSAEYPDADVPVGGGYVVANYDVISEDDPLGIAAHEFGHMLNLVDLYDVRSGAYVVGQWSLYDAGAWNPDGSGTHPADIDPWQKVILGWLRPTVAATSGVYVLPEDETRPSALVIPFPADHELFLLENRERLGWDSDLSGAGLLIWKVDTAIANPASTYWVNDVVNTPGPGGPSHDGVVLLAADGQGDLVAGGGSGDPFPGSAGVRLVTDDTVPSTRLLDGTPSHVRIDVLSGPGMLMKVAVAFTAAPKAYVVTAAPHPVAGLPLPVEVARVPSGVRHLELDSPFGTTALLPSGGVAAASVVPTSPGLFTFVVKDGGLVVARQTVDVSPGLPYADVVPAQRFYPEIGAAFVRGLLDDIPAFSGRDLRPDSALPLADFLALLLHLEGASLPSPGPGWVPSVEKAAEARGLVPQGLRAESPVTWRLLGEILARAPEARGSPALRPETVLARLAAQGVVPTGALSHPGAPVPRAALLAALLAAGRTPEASPAAPRR